MRILIFGLPGSGKTTIADKLKNILDNNNFTIDRINGDLVRTFTGNNDYSFSGRMKQSADIIEISYKSQADIVISDFIAPYDITRYCFKPDIAIWMNTINTGRYEDTNKIFEYPTIDCLHIENFNYDSILNGIVQDIQNLLNRKTINEN